MPNKDQASGVGKQIKGKANEVAGAVKGDTSQQIKGKLQKAAGKVQKAAGDAQENAKRKT